MNRPLKLFFYCLIALFSAGCTRNSPNSLRCDKCNVVVVSIDNLRADHIGAYGYGRPTTPAIDRWAAGSIVFENFFSTGYLTPVSEGSIHTGLYPEVNGMTGFY